MMTRQAWINVFRSAMEITNFLLEIYPAISWVLMVIIQSLPLHHSKVGHRITMAEGLPCAEQTPFRSLATQEDGIPNILHSSVGISRFSVPSFLLPLHSLLFLPGHRHGLRNEIKRWGKSGSQFEGAAFLPGELPDQDHWSTLHFVWASHTLTLC